MTHRGPFQPRPFCDSVSELGETTLEVGCEAAIFQLIINSELGQSIISGRVVVPFLWYHICASHCFSFPLEFG